MIHTHADSTTQVRARELARLDLCPHEPTCWLCRRADPYGGGLVGWCHLKDRMFCTREEAQDRRNQIRLCSSCHVCFDRRWFSLSASGEVMAQASPEYLRTLGLHPGITRVAPSCWTAERRAFNGLRITDADEFHLASSLAQQHQRQSTPKSPATSGGAKS